MCAIRRISNRLCEEWKLKRTLQDKFFLDSGNNLKYAVIFAHEGKSNTSFRTVNGLLLFVCIHNINKTWFYKINRKTDALAVSLEQERFTMMNRNSTNWVTNMINVSIESFKITTLKWNNSNRKQKLFHYVIRKDAFLSKGASNEEMASNFFHHRLKYKNKEKPKTGPIIYIFLIFMLLCSEYLKI